MEYEQADIIEREYGDVTKKRSKPDKKIQTVMESRDTYAIERAENSRLSEILHFLYNNFDTDETMLKSMLTNNPVTREEKELIRLDHERLARAIFKDSPCLIATDRTSGRIIGINLMIHSKNPRLNDNVRDVFEDNAPEAKLMKDYFEYLYEISGMVDFFERFPKAKAGLEFYAIAVDKNYRGKGIANALVAEGMALARTFEDVGFVSGIFTSLYSKKAAEKFGLRSYVDVDLLKYRNSEGTLVFQDTAPHNIVSVMAVEI